MSRSRAANQLQSNRLRAAAVRVGGASSGQTALRLSQEISEVQIAWWWLQGKRKIADHCPTRKKRQGGILESEQGATEHSCHWLREKKITNSFLNCTIRQQKSSVIPRFNACVPWNLRPGQDRERPLVFTFSHPTQRELPFCLGGQTRRQP